MTEPKSEKIGQNLAARFGAGATVGLITFAIIKLFAPGLGPSVAVNVLIVAESAAAIVTVLFATGDPEHPRI